MNTGYYLVCPQPNPASVESCAWVEVEPSVFPPLTAEQGASIGVAILSVWIAAYIFRQVYDFIDRIFQDD